MSAFRKAGIWLGLVEERDDVDDEFDEDDFEPPVRPRSLARQTTRGADVPLVERELRLSERATERGYRGSELRDSRERDLRELRESRESRESEARESRDLHATAASYRETTHVPGRDTSTRDGVARDEPRTASVRQLARPTAASTTNAASFPTQDNLALAPQVQLRERAVVGDDTRRRQSITTLHPTSYSEARAIGEHYREGNLVIMNLTDLDEPDAKRLVDFAAGLAFGLRGSMERVTNRVFLLSPANIQVSAEDKARIAEGGFFDQS